MRHRLPLAALFAALLMAASGGHAWGKAGGKWHVFLIAADHAEPVFDNAVGRLAALFKSRFGIVARTFSARYRLPRGARAATWPEIGRAALGERMGAGDACLFYFTSHGDERGLYMARHRALLPPEVLAELLDRTCGRRPTVVVVSACHSGTFLRPGLTAANR
ncbi:MAG: caspase family protein, partial [Rhodospirillaceae bacterium]|nr:caspase family protein [Rhodospirillaceae bacterium]